MGIQNRITQVGFAKQTAKASEATDAAYQVGVESGQVATLDVNEEALPQTWSTRLLEGHDRISVVPGATFQSLAMPKSVGLLLMLALGTDVISGAGPYTHTFTPAVTMPYGTFFARKDTEYFKVGDARVSELELTWELTGALRITITVMGCTYTFSGTTPYTATASERPNAGVLKGAGGTFTVHGQTLTIKGGSIKIAQGVEAVHGSNSVLPADVFPATTTVDVSLTVIPDNTQEFRRVITGTTGGSAVQTTPFYGAAVVDWRVAGAATTSLVANIINMKSMIAFPDTNAQGGPTELVVEGSVSQPTSGNAFTLVLQNDVAVAY